MRIAGYELDLLVVGFPGKSVCHGGMGWSGGQELDWSLEQPWGETPVRALCDDANVPYLLG
jgi:hypothetical protein